MSQRSKIFLYWKNYGQKRNSFEFLVSSSNLELGSRKLGTKNWLTDRKRYRLGFALALARQGVGNMARHMDIEIRSGPRYLVSFEVRAEWDEPGGTHILSEGTTENVGPEGTLVHLPK